MRIGIAGLGTVGGGVVKMLARRKAALEAATGRAIEIAAVCARDRTRDRGIDLGAARWFDNPVEMARAGTLDGGGLDVIVELIGGAEGVAKATVEAALAAGRHVVTANKALIAHHGTALARAAEAAGVALNYEAAVAGGIPIVRTLREALGGNDISTVTGILNGTCNYILTEMETTGGSFADILARAQALGYAEADPSFDIGGVDAAHKLAILASLAFGTEIDFDHVLIEGIEKIGGIDIKFAQEFGYRIKLLAIARRTAEGIEQRVQPALIPESSPLAAVAGVFNAVCVTGDPIGSVVLEGEGAGEGPTASAVVGDLMDIARGACVPPMGVPAALLRPLAALPAERHQGAYYLRLNAADRAGSMAAITRDLADADVSFERIVQRGQAGDGRRPVVFITHETSEGTMRRALDLLLEHEDVAGTPLMLRIEGD